jgi:hypothetical protein
LEVEECAQESVLNCIFGVFVVSSYATDGAKKLVRVRSIQRVKGPGFSALCRSH